MAALYELYFGRVHYEEYKDFKGLVSKEHIEIFGGDGSEVFFSDQEKIQYETFNSSSRKNKDAFYTMHIHLPGTVEDSQASTLVEGIQRVWDQREAENEVLWKYEREQKKKGAKKHEGMGLRKTYGDDEYPADKLGPIFILKDLGLVHCPDGVLR